ncbi:DNA-binding response regulator [Anaerocolumna cellulosilytica]|uniref:Stage 0 sporulation protein A homolog n=1 Tax=Anaerocolumna cellulosilytica TaxID=433286 RepID=A0A6S6R0Y9_9FIRM|nr:LytTR family DNA-binding domain-containing protein [Anaerocolumna cellulosilytica]MBB5196953.1 DNA-binding LytR/AlgR family response regulator [Anaerocolumna cellulosilytica]BCJ92648.1 DNA-binding response regulator [Anaerocolumna cellulosilytica]
MIRIAICDTDSKICGQVKDILNVAEIRLMNHFCIEDFWSGKDLYEVLLDGEYFDIIFLETDLQIMSGIEIGRSIRCEMKNETTQLVFISENDKNAMQLLSVRALDLIIKPVSEKKINTVLEKAINSIRDFKNLFLYKKRFTIYNVLLDDILYFESSNREVNIITNNYTDTFYDKLSNISSKLHYFIKIHKSYLINPNHILKSEYSKIQMSNGVLLPISRKNRIDVRNILNRIGLDNNYIF